MSVREDRILRADGSLGLYGVVDKADFALIIPRDGEGFWLVEQYRYAVQRRACEFPQGSWNADAAGSPVELAAAELREETGMEADDISHLGHLFGAYGFCSQGFDVYLATGLHVGPRTAKRASRTCSIAGWQSRSSWRWFARALSLMLRRSLLTDCCSCPGGSRDDNIR